WSCSLSIGRRPYVLARSGSSERSPASRDRTSSPLVVHGSRGASARRFIHSSWLAKEFQYGVPSPKQKIGPLGPRLPCPYNLTRHVRSTFSIANEQESCRCRPASPPKGEQQAPPAQ